MKQNITIRWNNVAMPWEMIDGVVTIPADAPHMDGAADYIEYLAAEEKRDLRDATD